MITKAVAEITIMRYTLRTNIWYPPIAQLVEQTALNRKVLGSSPSGRTIIKSGRFSSGKSAAFSTSPTASTPRILPYSLLYSHAHAQVAKLVYALVLGTSGAIRGGSSPLLRTKIKPRFSSRIAALLTLLIFHYANVSS